MPVPSSCFCPCSRSCSCSCSCSCSYSCSCSCSYPCSFPLSVPYRRTATKKAFFANKNYTYLYDESLLSILYLFRGCSAFSVPTASSYLWDRAALLLEHAETSHTSGTAQSTFFCPCWSGDGGRGSSRLVEMQSEESGNENDHHRPWEPRSHAARWSRVAAASSQSRMSPSRV